MIESAFGSSHGFLPDYPGNLTDGQATLLGSILDNVKDFGDLHDVMEFSDRIRFMRGWNNSIQELRATGLIRLVGSFTQRLRVNSQPVSWKIAMLVFRFDTDTGSALGLVVAYWLASRTALGLAKRMIVSISSWIVLSRVECRSISPS